MPEIENKILDLLSAVYELSESDKEKLNWFILNLSEKDKKKILIAIYERYKAFQKNTEKLIYWLQNVSNDLDDIKEKREAEKVLLDF